MRAFSGGVVRQGWRSSSPTGMYLRASPRKGYRPGHSGTAPQAKMVTFYRPANPGTESAGYENNQTTKKPNKKAASAKTKAAFEISGSPSWARTSDKRINSPVLYRLSYRGTVDVDEARILKARCAPVNPYFQGRHKLPAALKVEERSYVSTFFRRATDSLRFSILVAKLRRI